MAKRYRIEQIAPERPLTWAATEFFRWNLDVIEILKRDTDDRILGAAYNAVDWEKYYERMRGTPFYKWKDRGLGFLSLGGEAHIDDKSFFSVISDMSVYEEDYLKEHPMFNHVLHNLHVEAVEQMIDFIFASVAE